MANIFSLYGSVFIDNEKANKSIDETTRKGKTFSKSLDDIGKKAKDLGNKLTTRLTLPIVAGFGLMVKSASDMTETMNKIDVVFKNDSEEVKKWANSSIKNFGMAKQTALDVIALYGDMGTSMGLTTKESVKMGKEMVKRVGDLASFKNVSQDIAKTALTGIFTGETESLKQLGIVMTVANLEAFALSQGIKKNYEEMSEAEKVQLRYQYVMEKSNNAMDDYKNTSGSTANQTRALGEQFKDLSAKLGEKLLPIVNNVMSKLSDLVSWFSNLNEGTKDTILIILSIVAVAGPLLKAFSGLITVVKGVHTALLLISSNPVILGLTVIALAVWGIYEAWKSVNEQVEKYYGKTSDASGKGGGASGKSTIKGSTGSAGRFATGLDYVPHDYFPAYLDKGERVLTAKENKEYTKNQTTSNITNNNFNIEKIEVRDDKDIEKIAEELYYLQQKKVVA